APSLPEMLHDASFCCTAQIQLSSLVSAVSLSSESLDSIYTMTLWKAEDLIRVSLVALTLGKRTLSLRRSRPIRFAAKSTAHGREDSTSVTPWGHVFPIAYGSMSERVCQRL